MKTKIIEASNGFNWGKFLVAKYDENEWNRTSKYHETNTPLLREIGWSDDIVWVMDLQTGEGACYRPGGCAVSDLNKHKIWVCLLYENFLKWLYNQNLSDLDKLPETVELDAPSGLYGYRRSGERQDTAH